VAEELLCVVCDFNGPTSSPICPLLRGVCGDFFRGTDGVNLVGRVGGGVACAVAAIPGYLCARGREVSSIDFSQAEQCAGGALLGGCE